MAKTKRLGLEFLHTTDDALVAHCDIAGAFIDVVGDTSRGCYEWVRSRDDGSIVAHSNTGYGSVAIAMRDGINSHIAEGMA